MLSHAKPAIDLSLFKKMLEEFYKYELHGFHTMTLSDAEISHLSLLIDSSLVTSDAIEKLNYHRFPLILKRALTRLASLELLLKGDLPSHRLFSFSYEAESAFHQPLSLQSFQDLSQALQALGDDAKTALRLCCFLDEYNSNESQPLTCSTKQSVLDLLNILYWQNLSIRRIFYAENDHEKFSQFREDIRQHRFTKENLQFNKWRFILNQMASRIDSEYALAYTQHMHELLHIMMEEYETLFINTNHDLVTSLINTRARLLGLDKLDLTLAEQQFITYLAAQSQHIYVMTPDAALPIVAAYQTFKEAHPDVNIADLFAARRQNPTAENPDNFVGMVNLAIFKFTKSSKINKDALLQNVFELVCHFLHQVYLLPPEQPISCEYINKTMHTLIKKWDENKSSIKFILQGTVMTTHFTLSDEQHATMTAAKNGDVVYFETKMQDPHFTAGFTDDEGKTPLMYALANGHEQTALQLITDKRNVVIEQDNEKVKLRDYAMMHPNCIWPCKLLNDRISFEEHYELVRQRNVLLLKACENTYNSAIYTENAKRNNLLTQLILDGYGADAAWLINLLKPEGTLHTINMIIGYGLLGQLDQVESLLLTAKNDDPCLMLNAIRGFAKGGHYHLVDQLIARANDTVIERCLKSAAIGYAESYHPDNQNLYHLAKILDAYNPESIHRLYEELSASFMRTKAFETVDQLLRVMVQFKQQQFRYRLAMSNYISRNYAEHFDKKPFLPEDKYECDINRVARQADRIRGVMLSEKLDFDQAKARVAELDKAARRAMRLFTAKHDIENSGYSVLVCNNNEIDSDSEIPDRMNGL